MVPELAAPSMTWLFVITKLEVEFDLYTEPDPEPRPLGVETAIETTDGVTNDEIALVFIELPPISTKVRLDVQVPLFEI